MNHERAQAVSTPRQRWTFLAVISAALFLVGADNSILYTALPELRDQLGTTPLVVVLATVLGFAGLLTGLSLAGCSVAGCLLKAGTPAGDPAPHEERC